MNTHHCEYVELVTRQIKSTWEIYRDFSEKCPYSGTTCDKVGKLTKNQLLEKLPCHIIYDKLQQESCCLKPQKFNVYLWDLSLAKPSSQELYPELILQHGILLSLFGMCFIFSDPMKPKTKLIFLPYFFLKDSWHCLHIIDWQ